MKDQILYTGGLNPFKGLIGMPELPKSMRYTQAWLDYNKQVESVKSNAPDIVNWTELPITGIKTANKSGLFLNDKLLVIGDIFDLPVGYEFKKEVESRTLLHTPKGVCYHCLNGVHHNCDHPDTCKCASTKHNDSVWWKENIVLRIVKTEVKEEPTDWYSSNELHHWLIRENYSEEIASELAGKWAADLNRAFKKGYEKAILRYGKSMNDRPELSQPEPEESQKELWAEIIRESRFHDGTPSDLMAFTDHLSRLFTIQRKK